MKHIALFMAVLLLTLSFVSCRGNAGNSEETGADTTTEATTTEEVTTEAVTEDANAPESGTFGATVYDDFRAIYSENSTATAEELANLMIATEHIPYMMVVMPIEAGVSYLNGFKDQDGDDPTTLITGYKEGAVFAPMIGVAPFIGYIFTMEDGADVDAFVAGLKERADMRWNICTEADQMIVDVQGNQVLFVMCPISVNAE